MLRRVVLGVLVFVLVGAAPVEAQPMTDEATLADVVAYLDEQRQELRIPGMAVAIVQGDDVILLETFGEASPGVPVEPDTPFLINSISKSVTAVALVQLVDQGLVDPDTSVTDYIPELSPGADDVTITDLMHHLSGLREADETETKSDEHDTLERTVLRLEPLFRAGDGWEYTNGNYDTLALVVERVSGVPFEDYVVERVFGPLGMASSVVGKDNPGPATGHYEWLVLGYRPHDEYRPGTELGGAWMYSTAEDMARYVSAHLAKSLVAADDLLYRGLEFPEYGVEYGGGLYFEPPNENAAPAFIGTSTNWHDGASQTWRSDLWFAPEVGLGMVILANANGNRDLASERWISELSYGVKLIMSGEEPIEVDPAMDPVITGAKWAALVLLVTQALLAVAYWMGRRGWVVGLASAVDVVVLAYLVFGPGLVDDSTLLGVVRANPDLAVMVWAALALLGWGVVRTVLVFRARSAVPAS